ncbi:hypothetical protein [uncultured Dubosiella sp.]|uniref:hypothetical protein n=1 Tax=uncultured Dubosiella sp. TaxID=1937011 RepID=UPI0032B10159
MKEITSVGRSWAVWDGLDLIGIFDEYGDAVDAALGWDRRLWPWTYLFDIEQRAATYAQKKKEADRYA